jgi:hypothetical protein
MPIIKGHSYKKSLVTGSAGQGMGRTAVAAAVDNTPYLNRRTWFSSGSLNAIKMDFDRYNQPGYSFQTFNEIDNGGTFIPEQTGIYCFSVRLTPYDYNSTGKIMGCSLALREESSSAIDGSTQGFQKLLQTWVCPYVTNSADFGVEAVYISTTFLHRCISGASYGMYISLYHSASTTTGNIRLGSYNTTIPQHVLTVHWVSESY